MANREQKIADLLKLIKGEISPDDLKPKRLLMAIGYGDDPVYIVNEKEVTEEAFNLAASAQIDGSAEAVVTFGEGFRACTIMSSDKNKLVSSPPHSQ